MQKLMICFWLGLWIMSAQGQQSLTLEQCYRNALQNHPYGLQKGEQEKIHLLSGKIISSAWLPQLSLQAQASYQSEVIDIPFPGIDFPGPTRDQYRVTLDVQQMLYDGGMQRWRSELQETSHKAEQQKTEVHLYSILEYVSKHYFQAFLLDENLKILHLTLAEIGEKLENVKTAIASGVVMPSAQWTLEVELLNLRRALTEVEAAQRINLQILEIMVGEDLSGMQPVLPMTAELNENELLRPELKLFALQKDMLITSARLTATGNMPRVSAFVQGGYGKPGLNLLSDGFDFYYIAGVRLSWNLWDWQKTSRESQIQRVKADMIDAQQQAFLQQTTIAATGILSRIEQLEESLAADMQIIALREKIMEATSSQLENGIINSTEYLQHVHALAQARIRYETNKILLLQAKAEHNIITGHL